MDDSRRAMPGRAGSGVPLGIIGFGEVAAYLSAGLHDRGHPRIVAFDPHAADDTSAGTLVRTRAEAADVRLLASAEEVVRASGIVLVLTPGSASTRVADALAPHLAAPVVYADLSSAGVAVKQDAARTVEASGATFADGAILSHAVHDREATAILASGRGAAALADALNPWGGRVSVLSDVPGDAARMKNLRSLFTKGIEALAFECLETARHYGLDDEIVRSVAQLMDARSSFADSISYHLTTGAVHARRRAEEVAMAARIVSEAGVPPTMAEATAATLARVADLGLAELVGNEPPADYRIVLDLLAPQRSGDGAGS